MISKLNFYYHEAVVSSLLSYITDMLHFVLKYVFLMVKVAQC